MRRLSTLLAAAGSGRLRYAALAVLGVAVLVAAASSLLGYTSAQFKDHEKVDISLQAGYWTAKITIAKSASPASEQAFGFSVPFAAECAETIPATLADGESFVCNYDARGDADSYTVTETSPLPAGWDLNQLLCDTEDADDVSVSGNSVTFTLEPADDVTCTFYNVQASGTIVVEKQGPDGAGPFSFSGGPAEGCDGDLSSVMAGTTVTCGKVTPGAYTITEDTANGYILSGLSCTEDGTQDTTWDNNEEGRSAHINLQAGETVHCTWVNAETPSATLTLQKVCLPADDNGIFNIAVVDTDQDDHGVTGVPCYADVQALVYAPYVSDPLTLAPGGYTLTESISEPASLDDYLTSIDCGEWGSATGPTLPIILENGDDVLCVITNTFRSSLIFEKQVVDAGEDTPDVDFSFTTTGFTQTVDCPVPAEFTLGDGEMRNCYRAAPGAYTISEDLDEMDGWSVSISCTQKDSQGNDVSGTTVNGSTVTIQLGAKEIVTCTFENTYTPDEPEPQIPAQCTGSYDHVIDLDALGVSNYTATTNDGDYVVFGSGSGYNINLQRTQGDSCVVLGGGGNVITMNTGDNIVIVGGAGGNVVTTGDGDDYIELAGSGNNVTTNGGEDEVHLGSGGNVVSLGNGEDTLIIGALSPGAGGGNNINCGGGGDEVTLTSGGAASNINPDCEVVNES